MFLDISHKREIKKYLDGELHEMEDEIVSEFPLTVYVNNDEFATMVCSPNHLNELIIGFLASERAILFKDDIVDLQIDEDRGFSYVTLKTTPPTNHQNYSKRFIGSCCGKSRQFYFSNDALAAKTSMSKQKIKAEDCIRLMRSMEENSIVFKNTGGVHNAALCDSTGVLVDRSDIGRHNALDKLYGYSLLNNIPVRNKIIAFSGRVSSEVLIKAAKIGVGIVLSKSAPTDLAIQLAEDLNITTVGFIRGESFNVYSHSERIIK